MLFSRHLLLLLAGLVLVADLTWACMGEGEGINASSHGEEDGNKSGGEEGGEGEGEGEDGGGEATKGAGDGKKICTEQELHTLVDKVIDANSEKPADAASYIMEEASKAFGGKFEAIVSDCDFAYADYYVSECHVKTKTGTDQFVLAWKNQA